MKHCASSAILLTLCGSVLCAETPESLPAYQPAAAVSDTIRVWGSAQMSDLMHIWQRSFSRYQPHAAFDNHFYGAVSAIAGLYTGLADLAVSREIWPMESLAFEQVVGHRPAAILVASGSFDVPTKSDSLEIFVHKHNPISRLTLAELDGIFGAEHLRGGRTVRTWGALGLAGEWSNRPIHAYGFQPDNAGALFFSDAVLRGSRLWSCNYRAFANRISADGARTDAGRLILDALSEDPYGIAISNLRYTRPELKALPLTVKADGLAVPPTRENILNRTYPLARSVYIFLNRVSGQPLSPKLREFLRYILSREGQQDILTEGAYLPLPARMVQEQLKGM